MQKYIQKNLIHSIFIVFVANTLALFFHWYRLLWWFDMPMHFMGGFFCVWLVIYIYNKFFNNKGNSGFTLEKSLIKNVLIWTFIIGLGWEWFEWGTDLYTGAMSMHMLDSYSDLFFDMAGAFSAVFMLKYKYEYESRKQE
jgi:hypothetical protein